MPRSNAVNADSWGHYRVGHLHPSRRLRDRTQMSATSIRLPGLLLAGLLVLSAPLGAQDKSATIQEVSYIAPSNFGQMLQSSDLVARVRITDAKQNVVGPA